MRPIQLPPLCRYLLLVMFTGTVAAIQLTGHPVLTWSLGSLVRSVTLVCVPSVVPFLLTMKFGVMQALLFIITIGYTGQVIGYGAAVNDLGYSTAIRLTSVQHAIYEAANARSRQRGSMGAHGPDNFLFDSSSVQHHFPHATSVRSISAMLDWL